MKRILTILFLMPFMAVAGTIGEALDCTSLTWTTGGDASWFLQTSVTHDGVDAAQSGAISGSQSSWMQTTVSGAKQVCFWWKVSSESNYDFLRFYVDGTEKAAISGTGGDWERKTIQVSGTGTHTLKWQYSKDGSVNSGDDCGWVDQLVITDVQIGPSTTYYVNGTTGSDSDSGLSENAAKKTIQAAIDVATAGSTIRVAPGTYAPIETENKRLTISSVNGRSSTIIDGGGAQRCAYLGNSTNECATILNGFTLTNGYLYISWQGQGGAGVRGGTLNDCVIVGCRVGGSWSGYGGEGGGVSDSVVRRCIVSDCSALAGGGLSYSIVEMSVIKNCYARDDSGGAHGCILRNCLVSDNYGYNTGGGSCGSAMAGCRAYNCTIVNNEARSGGTINGGELYNCIVYGNTPVNVEQGWNSYESPCRMYSCVTEDPSFVDFEGKDYRLAADSPCIDTGDNAYVTGTRDLDGNARIANGNVDVGCYEYGSLPVIIDGLVAWYKFDGDANDSSGNGNNGVVHGATLTTDRFGNANSAYSFDGNDWIEAVDSVSLRSPTNAFTISVWFNQSAWYENVLGLWGSIVEKGDSRQYGLQLAYHPHGSSYWCYEGIDGYHVGGTGAGDVTNVSQVISINRWQHVTITCDGSKTVAYLDGEKVGEIDAVDMPRNPNNEPLYIGYDLSGGDEYFIGSLDDLRIYNRALLAAEVRSVYAGEFSVTSRDYVQSGLKGQWDGIDNVEYGQHSNTANVWTDLTGNGWDAAKQGSYGQWQDTGFEFTRSGTGYFQLPTGFQATLGSSWTIEAYVKPTTAAQSNFAGICGGHEIISGNHGLFLQYCSDSFYVGSCCDYKDQISLKTLKSEDVWPSEQKTYMAVCFDNDTHIARAYLNGTCVDVSTNQTSLSALSYPSFWIGRAFDEPGRQFDGNIYAVRAYSRALSNAEIVHNYTIDNARFGESTVNCHVVTFNANGGTVVSSRRVEEGAAVGTLPTATRTGYNFLGWFTEDGVQVTVDTIVTADMTVYAHWHDISLGGVTGATNVFWRTGGAVAWNTEESFDGWVVKSGAIGKSAESWIECVVTNGCRVSYEWRVSCEPGEGEEMYDYLSLNVDGEQVDAICGESGWTNGTVFVSGGGEHILRWTYQKDNRTTGGEDCGWLGRVRVDPEVSVTLNDNGATAGETPVVDTLYLGDTFTMPGPGTLARSCHTFGGWQYDGVAYSEGTTLKVMTNDIVLVAAWNAKILGMVTLLSPETAHVTTEKIDISFNVPENATAIHYTVDGCEPTIASPIYEGAFELVGKSATVKAIAYADDWFSSACATWKLTRAPWSASECLNVEARSFACAGDAEWTRDLEMTHDGEAAMRSGVISDKRKSEIQMAVVGSGSVSFWCKVSSERDPEDGAVYDGLAVEVDGRDAIGGLLGGEIGWTNITLSVNGDGEHVVSWRYEKDKNGKSGDDCAWLDELLWQADRTIVTSAETGSKDIAIGREWIEQDLVNRYGEGKTAAFRSMFGTDFDLAVRKPNGKYVNGRAASVWHDYVAGTDPTDTNSVFTASIEVVNGSPVITWHPDLKTKRAYNVWGKENLDDKSGWVSPTNSLHRFFKLTVDVP